MSKSFFGMILFLTKFDTHFVYTYLYYKCNLLRRGADSGLVMLLLLEASQNGGNDDTRCGFKKKVDITGSTRFYAWAGVDVFHQSLCPRLSVCGGSVPRQSDTGDGICFGRCAYPGERTELSAIYLSYFVDWIRSVCHAANRWQGGECPCGGVCQWNIEFYSWIYDRCSEQQYDGSGLAKSVGKSMYRCHGKCISVGSAIFII